MIEEENNMVSETIQPLGSIAPLEEDKNKEEDNNSNDNNNFSALGLDRDL